MANIDLRYSKMEIRVNSVRPDWNIEVLPDYKMNIRYIVVCHWTKV